MNSLGIMLEDGEMGQKDEKIAMEWFVKGMLRDERCWSGYCALNLGKLAEKYILDDVALRNTQILEKYYLWNEDSINDQRAKYDEKRVEIREHLSSLLAGQEVRENDWTMYNLIHLTYHYCFCPCFASSFPSRFTDREGGS